MGAAVAALPEQLTEAAATAREAFSGMERAGGSDVRSIAAFGLGTGGTACAAVGALGGPGLAVPFWAGHGSALPGFVDATTLVLVASSSGETEETLTATEKAIARGAQVVAIGGDERSALGRLAAAAGVPWSPVRPGNPLARCALGSVTVALLVALARVGLLPDPTASVRTASEALAQRRDALLAPVGPPAELARRLGRTFPLVYGSAGGSAVAAQWWKSQVNLNAKTPAFAASLPGLAHDELAGWGQGGDVTRQTMSLVLLRHAGEAPSTVALFDAVRAATDEVMADLFEVRTDGADELGRFLDLSWVGTLVSLRLAAREGVDPGPVAAVDQARAAAIA